VAAFLRTLDISGFKPKEPPPQTAAFRDIVDANRHPEEGGLDEVLERMGRPAAVTLEQIADQVGCPPGLVDKLREPKYRRQLSHLRECGYTRIANKMAKNGLWRVQGAKPEFVYVSRRPFGLWRASALLRHRLFWLRKLSGSSWQPRQTLRRRPGNWLESAAC
jgi:hypothetical protein